MKEFIDGKMHFLFLFRPPRLDESIDWLVKGHWAYIGFHSVVERITLVVFQERVRILPKRMLSTMTESKS